VNTDGLLRLCLVTGEYPPDQGGVADYSRCLAQALALRRVLVDVVTVRRRRPAVGSAPGPVDNAGSPPPLRGWLSVHRAVRGWGWSCLPALRGAVSVLRPDVVHLQYQAAAYDLGVPVHLAPWWLRGRDRSIVVTYHDLRPPYLFPKAGRLRPFALWSMGRLADRVVATNAADYQAAAHKLGAGCVGLIPIGSNVPDQPPPEFDRDRFRQTAGIGAKTALVAYFGMLSRSKGAAVLLAALGMLRAAGRDVCLVMVGSAVGASDPTNRRDLRAFEAELERLELQGAVRWTGTLPEAGVSAWLHAADVVALPYADGASYRRGSLLAALTHGRPVITTVPSADEHGAESVVPEAPPALADGLSASLVPANDPHALAGAIAAVLDHPDLARRLGQGARQLSRAFDWAAIAERHLALYAHLREERPA
jgi:glycosyltransferase involved in cell wall biosynthesis